MTRLGWHRSNRNLRNLYPVRDYSHSRIIHGGVCVNAIDKPLKWAVGFFFASTDLSLELGSYIYWLARMVAIAIPILIAAS